MARSWSTCTKLPGEPNREPRALAPAESLRRQLAGLGPGVRSVSADESLSWLFVRTGAATDEILRRVADDLGLMQARTTRKGRVWWREAVSRVYGGSTRRRQIGVAVVPPITWALRCCRCAEQVAQSAQFAQCNGLTSSPLKATATEPARTRVVCGLGTVAALQWFACWADAWGATHCSEVLAGRDSVIGRVYKHEMLDVDNLCICRCRLRQCA